MTRRLYHADLPEPGGPITLSSDGVHHARVLRSRAGDALVLFDGRGHEADATLLSTGGACEVGPRRAVASQTVHSPPGVLPVDD